MDATHGDVPDEIDEKTEDSVRSREGLVIDVNISTRELMHALVLVHTTAESLVQQLTAIEGQSVRAIEGCTRTAKQLILLLERPVQKQKQIVLDSVRKLLNLTVPDNGQNSNNADLYSGYWLQDNDQELNALDLTHEEKYITELLNENDLLRKDLCESNDYIKELDRKEETFIKEKHSLKEEIKILKERLRLCENERDQIQLENKQMESHIVLLEKNEQELNEEIEQKDKQCDTLTVRYQELEKEHAKANANYQHERETMHCEKDSLENQLRSTNATGEKLQLDLNKLQTNFQSKEDELRILHVAFDQHRNDCENNIKELQKERDSLAENCNHLNLEIDRMKNESKREMNRIRDLEGDVKQQNNVILQKEDEITHLHSEIEGKKMSYECSQRHLESEKVTLTQEKIELENQRSSLRCCVDKLEKENMFLKDNLDVLNKETHEKGQQISESNQRVSELQSELESAKEALAKLEHEKEKLLCLSKEKSDEIENLEKQLQEKEVIVAKLHNRIEHMKADWSKDQIEAKSVQEKMKERIETLQIELKKLQDDKTSLTQTYKMDIQKKGFKITEMERQITHLERKNNQLSEACNALEGELNFFKCKRVMQIQLYSQHRTSLTSNVEEELTALLKSKLESEKLQLEFVQCAKSSDIQINIPVLLLCITVSRLGTDVANAVQGLPLNSKMAVVIFHHKDTHALPNQSSERVLTGQDIRNLGGVYDLAFLSGKGIYSCEMNDDNIISLVSFVNREGVRYPVIDSNSLSAHRGGFESR